MLSPTRQARTLAAVVLSVSAAALASCSASVDPVDDDATSSTTGNAGTGAGSSSGGGGAGTGGAAPFSCDQCVAPSGICVDDLACAATCPDARAACHPSADASDPSICCPGGDQCCAAALTGAIADVCHPAGEPCPVACPGGQTVCGSDELCALDAETSTYSCVTDCNPYYLCNDLCCPLGSTCEAGACVLADLTIDAEQLQSSAFVTEFEFQQGSCSFFEGCIGAIGPRKLLRFDLKTPNIGDGDLFLGDPSGNPLFVYSSCHDHMHFEGYARYRLLDAQMNEVATGHKQAFCLLDWEPFAPDAPDQPLYSCGYQGIQKGWADTYESNLPCQWVDVTGLPPGDYQLDVAVNEDHTLGEKDYSNNNASVTVTIP